MNPPLRAADDRAALVEALLDGTITAIATDHAPHTAEEKWAASRGSLFGVVGLETAFPALYTGLTEPGATAARAAAEAVDGGAAGNFRGSGGRSRRGRRPPSRCWTCGRRGEGGAGAVFEPRQGRPPSRGGRCGAGRRSRSTAEKEVYRRWPGIRDRGVTGWKDHGRSWCLKTAGYSRARGSARMPTRCARLFSTPRWSGIRRSSPTRPTADQMVVHDLPADRQLRHRRRRLRDQARRHRRASSCGNTTISPSNFRYTRTLAEVLEENHIPGICGVDTRALTRMHPRRGQHAARC